MKHIPLLLALLSPGAALAAACDMSAFRDIDQQYLSAAPACISSGDYSSAACARIDDLKIKSNEAAASVRALRCDDSSYVEDAQIAVMRTNVRALEQAGSGSSTPVAHHSADNGAATCTKLMSDIAFDYDLTDLKLIPNKTDITSFYPIVPCTYEAIRPTVNGNIPVIVQAQLNQSNKRYRISIR